MKYFICKLEVIDDNELSISPNIYWLSLGYQILDLFIACRELFAGMQTEWSIYWSVKSAPTHLKKARAVSANDQLTVT